MKEKSSARRILVVDDDPTIRRCIELCIDSGTRQVDLRGDGDAGLAAARELDPDLVILDIAMPGMDGWEVLRRLRRDGRSNTPVLVLTALGLESREQAELGGADEFMTKPFRPEELREAVDRLTGA